MRAREPRLWIGLTVAAAYLPSLWGDFLIDDGHFLVGNPAVRLPWLWPTLLYDAAAQSSDPGMARLFFRPLTTLSWAVNWALGGGSPVGFHLVDVGLHALNASLLFALLRRAAPAAAAAAGALLFALHPAQAEAVAYISGARATLLSTSLVLAALLLHRRAQGAAWAAAAAAALAKEAALCLPALVAVLDWVSVPRESWSRRRALWAPFVWIAAGVVLLRTVALGRTAQRGFWGGTLESHAGFALQAAAKHLQLAAWPSDLRPCYGFRLGPAAGLHEGAAVLALAALAALAVWSLRRRGLTGAGLAWAGAAWLPAANLVPLTVLAADRFLYLPLAGAAFCVTALWSRLPARAAAAGLALALPLGLASAAAQLKWRDAFTLHLEGFAAAPRDPCAAMQLAGHYARWGRLERAAELLEAAQGPSALEPQALAGLARVRLAQGRGRDAAPLLRAALEREPGRADWKALLAAIGEPR